MSTTLPAARYVVIAHEGVWKINLDNRYFGPFPHKDGAIETALRTAREAAEKGYPAQVLVMDADAGFETLWDSAADQA